MNGRLIFQLTIIGCLSFSPLALSAGTPQTITFPEIPAKLQTEARFALGATASSGLPVSYSVVSPTGVATVTGGTVTLSGTLGVVTIKASQAGDATYDAAEEVYRSFVIVVASQRFVKVAAGGVHTVGIRADGTLWAWGRNNFGQLGDGSMTDRTTPVQIGSAANWAEVACGFYHNLAVKSDGTLWAWGFNYFGQLGDGTTADQSTPVQIGSATNWSSVAGGLYHTVAVKTDGTLWAWGLNTTGQLGDGSTNNRNSPVQVGSATNWSSAECGLYHTAAVKSDGTLWAWGMNSAGELGDGSTTLRTNPVQVGNATNWSSVTGGNSYTVAVKRDGTLWAWGFNSHGQFGDEIIQATPVQIGSATNWSAVAGGDRHTVAVRTDGTLWAWRGNTYGQLGDGTKVDRTTPVQIGSATNWSLVVCGGSHTVAVRTDGTLWAWGYNANGQLGNGSMTNRTTPAQIGSATNWSAVAGGDRHTVAVRTDGTLWAWGDNEYGQLGDGTMIDRAGPVQVGSTTNWSSVAGGSAHTAAVKTDGTLWAWGMNSNGQLGNGSTTNRSAPVQIGSATNWSSVACGLSHTAAVKTDGTLWAWGKNSNGQLGNGSTTNRSAPVQIGSATNWSSVACGGNHTVAVKSDGTLWAWGFNQSGQLGDGTMIDRTAPVQVGSATNWSSVTSGDYHTLAMKSDGTLWAWGGNSNGQLGNGSTTNRTTPVQIGSATNWSSVTSGEFHTLAVQSDGTLWAWGYNDFGQLGDGTTADRSAPVQIGSATNWSSVAGGLYHTVAVKSDGTLWAWGYNAYGQMGDTSDLQPRSTWPGRAVQSISYPSLSALRTGETLNLAAAATSGLPITYTVEGPATLGVGNVLSFTGPGSVTVRANQAGNDVYHPAPEVSQSLTVTKSTATVTLGKLLQTFDGTRKSVTATTDPAGKTVVFTYEGGATAPINAGTYAVVGTINDPIYEGSATGSLQIAKASQTITFANPGAQLANATVNLSASGGGSGNLVTLTVEGPATLGIGNLLAFTGAGSVTVRANQSGNDLYHPAPEVAQTFSVTKATATVTLGNLSQSYDGTARPVTATTNPSGKTVILTYDDSTTAPTGAGSYIVVGTINDPIYEGSTSSTLFIAKAGQTITFAAMPDQLATESVTLSATSGSGQPLVFVVESGPAVLGEGNLLTFTGAGEVRVRASQAGNSDFDPAADVTHTFNVVLPQPDVAVGLDLDSLVGLRSYGNSGQQLRLVSRFARPVTGLAILANRTILPDRRAADRLAVRANPGNRFFSITYSDVDGNATAGIVSGFYRTPAIDGTDALRWLTARISPNKALLSEKKGKRTVYLRKTFTTRVRASSTLYPPASDAGVIEVLHQ